MRQDNIPIDMSTAEEPMFLSDYLESWRMKVSDTTQLSLRERTPLKSLTPFEVTRVQPFM